MRLKFAEQRLRKTTRAKSSIRGLIQSRTRYRLVEIELGNRLLVRNVGLKVDPMYPEAMDIVRETLPSLSFSSSPNGAIKFR